MDEHELAPILLEHRTPWDHERRFHSTLFDAHFDQRAHAEATARVRHLEPRFDRTRHLSLRHPQRDAPAREYQIRHGLRGDDRARRALHPRHVRFVYIGMHPDNGGIEQRHELLSCLDELTVHHEHSGEDSGERRAQAQVVDHGETRDRAAFRDVLAEHRRPATGEEDAP